MAKRLLIVLLLFFGFAWITSAEPQYPERPMGYVNDYASVLGNTSELEAKIDDFEENTSNEIAIAVVNTLDGVSIEEYAVTLFEKWGIGKEDVDNGVLLLVAIEERQVRIEVGYGLEGALPDVAAGSIIRNDITPNFAQGDYAEGVSKGVDAIMKSIEGEYQTGDEEDGNETRIGSIIFVVALIVVVIIIIYISRKKKGGPKSGTKVKRKSSRSSWTSFGSGSSFGGSSFGGGSSSSGSGGSFGGFGGGSSGGGGASGKW